MKRSHSKTNRRYALHGMCDDETNKDVDQCIKAFPILNRDKLVRNGVRRLVADLKSGKVTLNDLI